MGWAARRLLGYRGVGFPSHVRYVTLTGPLPFEARSVHAVYLSHVLEHLHLDEGCRLLRECHRILVDGGLVRIVVPDTEHILREYQSSTSNRDGGACVALNERLGFRPLSRPAALLQRAYVALTDFHAHKFMYDRYFLRQCLEQAGFVGIEEAQFAQSRIPEIADVELETRIGHGYGFGFEAVRRST